MPLPSSACELNMRINIKQQVSNLEHMHDWCRHRQVNATYSHATFKRHGQVNATYSQATFKRHRQVNATYSQATLKSSHLDSIQEKSNVSEQWPDEHSLLH